MSATPLFVFSRAMLAVLLIVAWLAPARAQATTCETTETGWDCSINITTYGEGPRFTFTITEDQTVVEIVTYTSLTCDDHATGQNTDTYAADPYLKLYDDGETLLFEDDDSASHNDGTNLCWDSYLNVTLDSGDYELYATAYDADTIGAYTLEVSGGEWDMEEEEPEPTPTPTPEPEPTPEPTPEPDPSPTPTPEPTPNPTPAPTPQPTPDEDPEPEEPPQPVQPPEPAPTPEPSPQPTPTPVPPPTVEFDFDFDIDDILIPDGDVTDDDLIFILPDDFDFDELEIDELFIDDLEGNNDEEDIDELPEIEDFEDEEEEPTDNNEEPFDEEEPEEIEPEEPDPDLEDLGIQELIEDDEQLQELIEELETEDVLEEILEDNTDFFEEAEDEELEQIFEKAPEIFNEAPKEVKEEFEAEVNVFSGAFDDYEAEGQNVTVGERRTIVAATAVVSAVAIQARPTPTQIMSGPSSGPSTGTVRRRR